MARHSRSRSRSTSPHSKRRRHSHRREKPRSRSRDRGKDLSNSERSQSKNAEKNNYLKGTSRNGEKVSEKITEKSKDIPQVVTPNQQEQEEKIRLRRERVEQWRREREAAKKAEEETKAQQLVITSDSDVKKDEQVEPSTMDFEITTNSDNAPATNTIDATTTLKEPTSEQPPVVEQPRRNPLLGIGNKKATISFKGKSTKFSLAEDEERASSTLSRQSLLIKDSSVSTNADEGDAANDDEEDPLDAYMKDVEFAVERLNEQDKKRAKQVEKGKKKPERSEAFDEEEENAEEEDIASESEDILAFAAKKLKKKDLAVVDHNQVKYEPFRKDFYIEPPEMHDMTPDQVDLLRVELDGIKIRGIDCPKPIKKWTHAGLPAACLQVIKKLNFEKPTPIQAQAIPAIMAGRDVIGVAKTGSGKTVAFLLPMFRHIKDQRPLEPMEGPVAIIMTPTRELAVQIHRECKHFLKALALRAVCAYGGSPIKDQIADLKRGAEIIVCTPGRMIDLLCANSGRVTNLKRVTYLVLDEADRMFDMGFEPQVMKIVNNVRPDRQTVLFSATFPRQMESLARKVLKRPLEITVGGRSVVAQDVMQLIEVREESTKFVRLLEILGQQYNDDPEARTLIFVDRQEAADNLLRDLIRKGYPCMSLHGGKDQLDRDSTIADFKSGVCQILIATSVAARGLDVKQLKLVINYECPNHMEDYVHRVGRTGRAGNKGTAYTFITPEQDRYAMDIVKALKLSGGHVGPELQQLADEFQEKVKAGNATYSGSGFGGKGLERLDEARDLVKKAQRKTYGDADDQSSDEDLADDDHTIVSKREEPATNSGATATSAAAQAALPANGSSTEITSVAQAALKAAQEAAARINAAVGASGVQRAKDIIADINSRFKENSVQGNGSEDNRTENVAEYSVEIEINDYPQKARWKVTNKEQISQITELTGAAITTRGTYFPPGRHPAPGSGERKLYLFVEGENEYVVEKAKNEIKRILTETTLSAIEAEARNPGSTSLGGYGKYTVV